MLTTPAGPAASFPAFTNARLAFIAFLLPFTPAYFRDNRLPACTAEAFTMKFDILISH